MTIQPFLFFEGRCDEALAFYRQSLGAEVISLVRYRDCPEAPPPGAGHARDGDKVMHAAVRIGATTLMASDGHCQGKPAFEGFALTITVPEETAADRVFAALAEGGQVRMPLAKTFFSPRFGMVIDRFGVCWMVLVGQ